MKLCGVTMRGGGERVCGDLGLLWREEDGLGDGCSRWVPDEERIPSRCRGIRETQWFVIARSSRSIWRWRECASGQRVAWTVREVRRGQDVICCDKGLLLGAPSKHNKSLL